MRVFHGEPTIGGRYSALSPFGIVPAALMGIEAERLLTNAERMAEACRSDATGATTRPRARRSWRRGRDKVCIEETDGNFGLWAEQLIAESTGKQGKGLIPAPGESFDGPDRQGAEVHLADSYAIGGEFFRWEFAVAVAGSILEINPFDQPDVQAAKDKTKDVLASGDDPKARAPGLTGRAARLGGAAELRRDPGLHRSGARKRLQPLVDRAHDELRRDEGARPALPPLDRPAAQGRPADGPVRPGGRRHRTRDSDPGRGLRLRAIDSRSGRRRLSLTAGTWPADRASQTG